MNNLKEMVKDLLNEADSDVKSGYFFRSEATDNNDDHETYYDGVDEFTSACRKCGINYAYEDNFGGEGQGDDYWSVYSFTDGTDVVYVKFQGWYASFSGSEFSEWLFVEPKKVEVVKYVVV